MNYQYHLSALIVLLLGGLCAGSAAAQEFEVQGLVSHRIYMKASLQHELRKEFVVDVSGEKSLIRTTDPGSGDYAEKSFEGGTIYSLYGCYSK